MRIHEDKARRLLKALGYENADRYSPKILIERLKGIEANVKDDIRLAVKEAALKKLMVTIMRSVKTGDTVELIDATEVERNKNVETFGKRMEMEQAKPIEQVREELKQMGISTEKAKKRVTDALAISKKRVEGREASDDVQAMPEVLAPATDNRETIRKVAGVTAPPGLERAKEIQLKYVAEEAKKAAEEDAESIRVKRTSKMEWPDLALTEWTPPAVGTQRRAIFEVLSDACEDDPISKDEVYESVRTRFPDSKSLKVTVDGFPHWLPRSFPFTVHQTDKKYWLAPRYERKENEPASGG